MSTTQLLTRLPSRSPPTGAPCSSLGRAAEARGRGASAAFGGRPGGRRAVVVGGGRGAVMAKSRNVHTKETTRKAISRGSRELMMCGVGVGVGAASSKETRETELDIGRSATARGRKLAAHIRTYKVSPTQELRCFKDNLIKTHCNDLVGKVNKLISDTDCTGALVLGLL